MWMVSNRTYNTTLSKDSEWYLVAHLRFHVHAFLGIFSMLCYSTEFGPLEISVAELVFRGNWREKPAKTS